MLAKFVGTWEATAQFRMAPDQPAVTSQGVETQRLVCGGLWLFSDYEGKLAGQSFEGHGTTGYDQMKKKYVGTWIDSMSSSLNLSEGTYDEKSKTFTYKTTSTDPQTGQQVDNTSKLTIKDNDHHSFVIIMTGPDGKEFESLRIDYVRKLGESLAKIVGDWDMLVEYDAAQDASDYVLRITTAGDELQGVLVSPRSGDHEFKSVVWKDNVLDLRIERDFGGTEIELNFNARLSEEGLSGKLSMVDSDQLDGKWTAKKKKQ